MTRFDIRSVTSELVLRFERHGLWSHASDVRIFAKELPELPILVAFGWYLLVVLHDDAGAAMVIG
jgi:hypothetical protein